MTLPYFTKAYPLFSPSCKRQRRSKENREPIRNADENFNEILNVPDESDESLIFKNYRVFERFVKRKMQPRLAVFCSDDDQLCYEYSKNGDNLYYCVQCRITMKYNVSAKIIKSGSESFVKMSSVKHFCQPRPYREPQARQFIHPPNFTLDYFENSDGRVTKELTVLDPRDSSQSYVFYFLTRERFFECSGCKKMNKYVTVKLRQSETDGTSYLELNTEHVCESKPNEKILENDAFQLQRNFDGKISNLVFPHPEISDSCYVFFRLQYNRFRCQGCHSGGFRGSNEARIFQRDSGEYYVKMGDFQHVCEAIRR